MNDLTGTDNELTGNDIARIGLTLGTAGGVIAFLIILFFVFATGMTFGQRGEKLHPKHSQEWHSCLKALSEANHD